MKITINDNRKIFAIQESFSEMFPFLKIEFFAKSNTSSGPASKKFMRSSSKTIGECRTVHSNGTLTILPKMRVSDLEQGIRDTFGISIQVFRKSGRAWLETTTTVDWTLDEQNRIGEEMSKPEVENEA